MALYPVKYPSASKGPVDIETMADKHLCNALRKLKTVPDPDPMLRECMEQEMERRGLDIAYPNGKPPEEAPPLAEPGPSDLEGSA
jgi:hypothetical protein